MALARGNSIYSFEVLNYVANVFASGVHIDILRSASSIVKGFAGILSGQSGLRLAGMLQEGVEWPRVTGCQLKGIHLVLSWRPRVRSKAALELRTLVL